ncbi:DUF202 domain-containing protein [Blastococcus mobilis]|uniref:DUF202 domain-containing protein n=1 Tax=Blastococcus mobilis TaxID=1938746 RepID=A0A239AJB3_9ACTN|nr:DUF202 domain-containing protein [Blastococcus mobilis]SNR95747.1 protein of unknown function [Blastococcus mobilis]
MSAPDTGLSNERTALAWRRTALAAVAGAAIVARLTFGRLGVVSVVGLASAVAFAGWILVESSGRYRHQAATRLRSRDRGGRAPFFLAAATMTTGMVELAALLSAIG